MPLWGCVFYIAVHGCPEGEQGHCPYSPLDTHAPGAANAPSGFCEHLVKILTFCVTILKFCHHYHHHHRRHHHHHHLLFWKRRFLPRYARIGRLPQGGQTKPLVTLHKIQLDHRVEKSSSASYPPIDVEASFSWRDALPHQPVRIRKESLESGNLFSGSWISASVPPILLLTFSSSGSFAYLGAFNPLVSHCAKFQQLKKVAPLQKTSVDPT